MSTRATSGVTGERRQWLTGFAMFAGVLMVVGGVWGVLAGISAILHDELYVTTPQYLYAFDLTSWGLIHLIIGAILAVAGVGVLQGATWARAVGVAVAVLSLFANFAYIPYFPIWSILIIAVDVIVIWALCSYGREPRPE
jgi:hypothetical protein